MSLSKRQEDRFQRTGDSQMRWQRKLEDAWGIIFGTYRVPAHLRAGPLGLVYVGPMGPNATPGRTYRDAWRGVRGIELTILGLSLYVEKVTDHG